MLSIKSVLLVCLSLLVSSVALAEREWPDRVFNCQVVTVNGAQGLVSLQSLSPEDAKQGAVGKTAITLLGNKGSAARVIQCVEKGKGKSFTDSSFQAWLEKLDQ
jgi:hypothetical protein